MSISERGYLRRVYAIEWHANLWRIYGTPVERCEAMMVHCIDCLDADYQEEKRAISDDPHINLMQAYLDMEFNSHSIGVLGISLREYYS